jgi:glutamate dehydrogenase
VALEERRRLFNLPRSSWQDYDKTRISAGGGVFSRKEKAIHLSREARSVIGLAAERATPQEIISAILRAKVDLLWFGGIGTYVKAGSESDESVGDRANDPVRIAAAQISARVVGEGANLAMTQRARIEYGLAGGRCNSDAIDNSAGVNTSDVEVNIKIALRAAARKERDKLLKAMTGEVAALVLRNNYLQPLAISLAERRGFEDFPFQVRMIQTLEARGILNRVVETLPDDTALAERQKAGKPLTRAEIGVLLAYAKIALSDDLLATDVTEDDALHAELVGYFPAKMQHAWGAAIDAHRLRREIIATVLANAMINRGGPTYMTRVADRTGAGADAAARAYIAARDIFALRDLNAAIDALDNKTKGESQLSLYRAVQDLLLAATVWLLRNVSFADGIASVIERFRAPLAGIEGKLASLMPPAVASQVAERQRAYAAAGVPAALATRIALLPVMAGIPDVIVAAEAGNASLEKAAAAHFAIAEALRIGRVEALGAMLPVTDYYEGLAQDRALETLALAHRRITAEVLASTEGHKAPVEAWLKRHGAGAERLLQAISGVTEGEALTVARLVVAANLLGDLTRG